MNESAFPHVDPKKVKPLLEHNAGKNVLFSEGTYQIEIVDPKQQTTYWPFLQVDDTGKVLDCFCTCSEAEKKKSCPHLAAAYQKIVNDKQQPLHVRFRDSLWNQLCQIASRRHGYDVKALKGKVETGFEAESQTGKKLFLIKPLTAKGKSKLKEIIINRQPETEDTSLKFSNLSQEELQLWKEGRPSHQLLYELSFWSDLAKWWMLLQEEGEPYTIVFSEGKSKLPSTISIHTKHFDSSFYIAEANWPQIIPSLATVKSPLPIYEFPDQAIKKITYDEQNKKLLLTTTAVGKPATSVDKEEAIAVGEWMYVPKKGFYPARIDPLLQEKEIPSEKIASVLHKHARIIQKYLEGTKLFHDSIKPQYRLIITPNGDLQIRAYLFSPGDLQKPLSVYFGPWAYLEGKGFYLLENLLFPSTEMTIHKSKVSDFINRHRHWLNQYEGFQTHLSSVESHMTYSITEEGKLRFDTKIETPEEKGEMIDFGDWIYLQGRGFYAKISARSAPFLKPGLTLSSAEVSSFISNHHDDLEQIKGFFSSNLPIERVGLKISLDEHNQIIIDPEYHFKSEELKKKAVMYGDYFYIPGQGFSEIPPQMRLPIAYQQHMVIDRATEPYFIATDLDTLKPFITSIDPRLVKPSYINLKILQIKRDKKTKSGGFILTLRYETDVGSISPYEVWKGVQQNQLMLYSQAGLIFLRAARFNWLKNINKKRWSKGGEQIRLTAMEWMRLNVFEDIKAPEDKKSIALLEELKEFKTELPLDLEGLKSHLRPYQEQGVRWLWFLYNQGLSGLLCDEMGLGKTHQAMALIAAAKNSAQDTPIKILVICPTSVIFHWEDLLKRFFPKIRVLVFYGAARNLEVEYDLLLTSYGTLRSEKKVLSEISFEIAIFDEIQIAKNAHSQTHKAMRKLDAKMRVGLTGTPIENHLLELKALFDIVLPSYLPNEALFKSLFVNPIEKNHDVEKAALLTRFIRPFIMRRKKTEVLLELPEKIEEVSYCTLSEEQRALYNHTIKASRELIIKELNDKSKPVPYIHIFALLTKLKQICDHPYLVTKQPQDLKPHTSGKWDLFVELLNEARDSGQKVVVFSQYLDMLDLIEAHLKERNINFAGIRGSTTDRKKQVERFRDDPTCEVFVASLQAAGVGIDLIAASVVIHYDRWWNPAKEDQATDRVHRMGQSRGVQVFKLVTKNTIEERIHQLIERKKALAGIIAYDDQEQLKNMSRDELMELLSMIKED